MKSLNVEVKYDLKSRGEVDLLSSRAEAAASGEAGSRLTCIINTQPSVTRLSFISTSIAQDLNSLLICLVTFDFHDKGSFIDGLRTTIIP